MKSKNRWAYAKDKKSPNTRIQLFQEGEIIADIVLCNGYSSLVVNLGITSFDDVYTAIRESPGIRRKDKIFLLPRRYTWVVIEENDAGIYFLGESR